MNKKSLLLFSSTIILTSCMSQVNQVYDKDTFHTQNFSKNYYDFFEENLKDDKYVERTYQLVNGVTYNTRSKQEDYNVSRTAKDLIEDDLFKGKISVEKLVEDYGNTEIKNIPVGNNIVSYREQIINLFTQSPSKFNLTWFRYFENNSIVNTVGKNQDESFRKGVFSKLTDSIIACDGTGSLVRVQLKEEGFSQRFNYRINEVDSMILSLRGGTNINYEELGIDRIKESKITLNFSFYFEDGVTNDYRKTTFSYPIDELHSDNSGASNTNIVEIEFNAEQKDAIKHASAISVNYTLDEHQIIKPQGEPLNTDYVFAVMLYEIAFPYSTWTS